jgi:hypothetical protein
MSIDSTITTRGLVFPAVGGIQLALYFDRCATGFRLAWPWQDHWSKSSGSVATWGLDAAVLRVRLVVERLSPGMMSYWGLV